MKVDFGGQTVKDQGQRRTGGHTILNPLSQVDRGK